MSYWHLYIRIIASLYIYVDISLLWEFGENRLLHLIMFLTAISPLKPSVYKYPKSEGFSVATKASSSAEGR